MNKLEEFNKKQLKTDLPEIRPGYTIRVYQKIKEGDKRRIQVFEGLVIARKHGAGINSTITVRKTSLNVGVERIFPLHAPFIEKIEVVKKGKVRRAKLYYIRKKSAKKSRLKEIKPEPKKVEEEV
ncbi:50S ribosomal protein L19 [Patescibacteria group bacterium]|nr:50S ribosomal protein L19 [Patescibacteria group bacterium]MBU1563763.1 50S ribosomal protein L19 [Patescibacteria group bacterium]MBU2068514.1 50S ribosomal protein L19 [Patescibacteria group bacterium]